MYEPVDSVCYLGGLIEVVEVAGVRDPFHLNIGAFRRNIRKDGWRLGRVAVGLQLQHRKGEIVFADFVDGGVEVPVAAQEIFRNHSTLSGWTFCARGKAVESTAIISRSSLLKDK
jgi:hypothetical protein